MVAPIAVKLIAFPKQMVGVIGAILTVGLATTMAVPFCVCELHPALLPITLYTVVMVGVAITEKLLAVFILAAGLQV